MTSLLLGPSLFPSRHFQANRDILSKQAGSPTYSDKENGPTNLFVQINVCWKSYSDES